MTPREDLGLWLNALRAQVSQELGGTTEVVVLSCCSWDEVLLEVCRSEAIPHVSSGSNPALAVAESVWLDDANALRGDDWNGEVSIWPGTPHEVRVVRFAWVDRYSQRGATAMLGRSQEHLQRASVELNAAWVRWRRTKALVRTSTGRAVKDPAVGWDSLVLPSGLLADLKATVEGFAGGKALYARAGIPWRRGILFHGPPGNGKTMVCRSVVGALSWPATIVTPSSDFDESDLAGALDDARLLAPSVLCLEDLDTLFKGKLMLSSFLNLLDGFESPQGVLVLATTNHPDELDSAITLRPSRFDRVFCIPPPGQDERHRYLSRLFGERLGDGVVRRLADETSQFSMAFLKELFVHASQRAASAGADTPSADDLDASLRALTSHLRGARREFSTSAPAGFRAPNA